MPYFLNRIYEWGRYGLLSLGGLLGTGSLVYGIFLGTTPTGILFIVGGSIWILQSGLMLVDNRKLLQDIRREIDNLEMGIDAFNAENQQLKASVQGLDTLKEKYIKEIESLHQNLQTMECQVRGLNRLKASYEAQTEALTKGNERLEHNNNDLKLNLDNLTTLKKDIQKENEELQGLLQEGEQQMLSLESIKQSYESENIALQSLIKQQDHDMTILRTQVHKLGELYENSRKLMVNMAQASSVFDGFADSLNDGLVKIDKTEEGLADTLTGLNSFLGKLSKASFRLLDKDGNNQISQEEFARLEQLEQLS